MDTGADFSGFEEWRELTVLQQSIVQAHIENPRLGKTDIAKVCNCAASTVLCVLRNEKVRTLISKAASAGKVPMVLKALDVYWEALNSKNERIRLQAATRILEDAGELKYEGKAAPVKGKEDFKVSWSSGLSGLKVNGISNPVLPPS